MRTSKPLAVVCSDLHLSHIAPSARSTEPNWYEAQDRVLRQVIEIANDQKVGILIAGDLFDRYNSPPELINWAINLLKGGPLVWAIPGQHDMPHHNLAELYKSAYWTLVRSGVIENLLGDNRLFESSSCQVHPFPFGTEVSVHRRSNIKLNVAVIHACVMKKGFDYPGLPTEWYVEGWKKKLKGFNTAVFGDNHKGFEVPGKPFMYNCGCLIRRKSSERELRPSVGVLMDDGSVERRYLDCSMDRWVEGEDLPSVVEGELGLKEFIEELGDLGEESLDFRAALTRYLEVEKPAAEVRRVLLKLLEAR